jgi:hypothetical protein
VGACLVAGDVINNIETFCDLGKHPVLGIDDFAIQVNNPADRAHISTGFLELRTYIPDACSFSGAGLTINKNIRGGLVPERGGENRGYFINLRLPVGQDLGTIRMPQDLPVLEYPVIDKVFFE